MGREANCWCKWGDEEGDCKVLVEGRELILRGGIRRRVSLASLTDVSAAGEDLTFRSGLNLVQLRLGAKAAQSWLKAIAKPEPSLARKLGVTSATKLLVMGGLGDKQLDAAIAESAAPAGKDVDLIILCAHDQAELERTFVLFLQRKNYSGPVWAVYPKGVSEIKESAVRALFRSHGFVDNKVVSVSTRLTALRFAVARESKAPRARDTRGA